MCYISEQSSPLFQTLISMGFKQLVKQPTHEEGRLIDLLFYYSPNNDTVPKVIQQSQYFTDHDMVKVVKGKNVIK